MHFLKQGILTKVVTTYTNGEQEVHNFRGTVKREDTFVKGYLASRYHPNAKLTRLRLHYPLSIISFSSELENEMNTV